MQPIHRCRLAVCAALVALLEAGCGPERGAEPRAPTPGRYGYSVLHPAPGGGEEVRLRGTLVITHSDADSIAGHFEVPQLQPQIAGGRWENGAYSVLAHPIYFGILEHRISLDPASGAVLCRGEYSWTPRGGGERSVPAQCSLVAGDALPDTLVTPTEEHMIRDIDRDTVPLR